MAFLVFYFTHFKYKFREVFVQQAMRYFEPNESKMVRVTKNLNMIKEIQINTIFLSDKLTEIFYGENRFFLYFIFRYSLIVFICSLILIIFFWNTKFIFLSSVFGIYCFRNKEEILCYFPKTKEGDLFTNNFYIENVVRKVENKIKSSFPLIKDSKQETLFKKFYYYENERWFVFSGFIPTNLERPHFSDIKGDYEIKPDNFVLDKGWKWSENWKIVINEDDTDAKGWTFAKSFKSHFHNRNKKFDIVRRRAWSRTCYKVKTE